MLNLIAVPFSFEGLRIFYNPSKTPFIQHLFELGSYLFTLFLQTPGKLLGSTRGYGNT
jgi:hypothetical protein